MMLSEQIYEEYLSYLYGLANYQYSDCPDIDVLIQETLLAFIVKQQRGEAIQHPKGLLSTIMHRKHNDWLRQKYRNRIVSYGDLQAVSTDPFEDDLTADYTAVRREIGRLIGIYREVTVRHYMHGQSVEQIAGELNIPKGTVLSRLSSARKQLKERIDPMQDYSPLSYEPKQVALSIFGNFGLNNEPFSLLASNIEQNILILAYDRPVSIQNITDALGIPCAYLEPLIDKLIDGELLGKTSGGLVYTRCFMQTYTDSFGDIPAQEAIAARHAAAIAEIVHKHTAPLMEHPQVAAMSDKQKATLLLFVTLQTLSRVSASINPYSQAIIPERPNAGRWLAFARVMNAGEKRHSVYDSSGPLHISYDKDHTGRDADCLMYDYQSVFGDTHHLYKTFPYKCSHSTILRFYASLFTEDIKPDIPLVYDLIPQFEQLHIVKRNESGKLCADIPALTFEEEGTYWIPAKEHITAELTELLQKDLQSLFDNHINRVPKHIDEPHVFRHLGAHGAYLPAQLLAIVNSGAFPYPVIIGETPIIYLMYRG